MAAPKVMHAILLYLPKTSEADNGGTAVEVVPSCQSFITFGGNVTDLS